MLVYITESHHHVLAAWAQLRRTLGQAPRLLTFDYHTDTQPAFRAYATQHKIKTSRTWREISRHRLEEIDFRKPESITAATNDLQWDEHIDAAVQSGILDIAFVASFYDGGHIESNEQIALDQNRPSITTETHDGVRVVQIGRRQMAQSPFTYRIPDSRVVVLPHARVNSGTNPDVADRAYRDAALESGLLGQRVGLITEITKSAGVPGLSDSPFILDFDLDYFNTRKAIAPIDHSVLDELIQRAALVTIARESACVRSCQLQGEGLDSDFLEHELLAHLSRAVGANGSTIVVQRHP